VLFVDSSTKDALSRVNDVVVELHMTFVHVDFPIMDMDGKIHNPIILGRPYLELQVLSLMPRKGI
jgi:hypothetical protein